MNYKTILYIINILICVYALSGVNFDSIIKANKKWEAWVLVFVISISLGYLITNFITDFIEVNKVFL